VVYLLQYSPAGFERYFHELSEPAEFLGLPPRPTMPDRTRVADVAARYGCVFSDPSRVPGAWGATGQTRGAQ
jgi:hypothetical protein